MRRIGRRGPRTRVSEIRPACRIQKSGIVASSFWLNLEEPPHQRETESSVPGILYRHRLQKHNKVLRYARELDHIFFSGRGQERVSLPRDEISIQHTNLTLRAARYMTTLAFARRVSIYVHVVLYPTPASVTAHRFQNKSGKGGGKDL